MRDETYKRLDFCVDRLEDRRMLAGNVNVKVNNAGDLIITGDHQDNEVSVFDSQDRIFISAQNSTVNRLPMGDRLVIEGLTPRDLKVRLKGGNDSIHVQTAVGGFRNGTINTGSGNDGVAMIEEFTGNLRVALGSGIKGQANDSGFEQTFFLAGEVAGNFKFNGGSTNDRLTLSNTVVNGTSKISLGAGNDHLKFNDFFGIAPVFARNVSINGGGGFDSVVVTDSNFPPQFSFDPTFIGIESNGWLDS